MDTSNLSKWVDELAGDLQKVQQKANKTAGEVSGLPAFSVTEPAAGQILSYDAEAEAFKNADPDPVFEVTTPTAGQILEYDAETEAFVNADLTIPSGGSAVIMSNSLSDLPAAADAHDGDIFIYTGKDASSGNANKPASVYVYKSGWKCVKGIDYNYGNNIPVILTNICYYELEASRTNSSDNFNPDLTYATGTSAMALRIGASGNLVTWFALKDPVKLSDIGSITVQGNFRGSAYDETVNVPTVTNDALYRLIFAYHANSSACWFSFHILPYDIPPVLTSNGSSAQDGTMICDKSSAQAVGLSIHHLYLNKQPVNQAKKTTKKTTKKEVKENE